MQAAGCEGQAQFGLHAYAAEQFTQRLAQQIKTDAGRRGEPYGDRAALGIAIDTRLGAGEVEKAPKNSASSGSTGARLAKMRSSRRE